MISVVSLYMQITFEMFLKDTKLFLKALSKINNSDIILTMIAVAILMKPKYLES